MALPSLPRVAPETGFSSGEGGEVIIITTMILLLLLLIIIIIIIMIMIMIVVAGLQGDPCPHGPR